MKNKESSSATPAIPSNWDVEIHKIWSAGKTQEAITAAVNTLNSFKENKPKGNLVQLGYYLFLLNDYVAASAIFKNAHQLYPDDKEVLVNLCVTLSRSKQDQEAAVFLKKVLKDDPLNFVAWDSMASTYHRLGDYEKAAKAGTNSLTIKDKKYGAPVSDWQLPEESIEKYTEGKKKVIAFSLWGNKKRYIFGALRNLLLAPDIYPDWELWFYVDSSVSVGFLDIIKTLGGKIIMQSNDSSLKEKLGWRFAVADHSEVGYFMVRDVDSVFSVREYNAVQAWLDSGKWFHIIRDWWTHTDLILAGLWGGVAGVLPNIQESLKNYSPEAVTTPNIDQWFLRDCIWRYIKTDCLIHDRCFSHGGAIPLPGKNPQGNTHIGVCENTQNPELQERILAAWIRQGHEQ